MHSKYACSVCMRGVRHPGGVSAHARMHVRIHAREQPASSGSARACTHACVCAHACACPMHVSSPHPQVQPEHVYGACAFVYAAHRLPLVVVQQVFQPVLLVAAPADHKRAGLVAAQQSDEADVLWRGDDMLGHGRRHQHAAVGAGVDRDDALGVLVRRAQRLARRRCQQRHCQERQRQQQLRPRRSLRSAAATRAPLAAAPHLSRDARRRAHALRPSASRGADAGAVLRQGACRRAQGTAAAALHACAPERACRTRTPASERQLRRGCRFEAFPPGARTRGPAVIVCVGGGGGLPARSRSFLALSVSLAIHRLTASVAAGPACRGVAWLSGVSGVR
eukprot:52853-Chlamydomonas_euryale.AAC.5